METGDSSRSSVAADVSDYQRHYELYHQDLLAGAWSDAEKRLRQYLARFPDDPRALRDLSNFLSSQGRRYESAALVDQLVRRGLAEPRELLSLIDRGRPIDFINFDSFLLNHDPGIFELDDVRRRFFLDDDVDAALRISTKLMASFADVGSVIALHGRLLAIANDDEGWQLWRRLVEQFETPIASPDLHAAWGHWYQNRGRHVEAVASFYRTLLLDPTDRRALRAMLDSLIELDRSDLAASVQRALATLNELATQSPRSDGPSLFDVSKRLHQLGRYWESLGWFRFASRRVSGKPIDAAIIEERMQKIRQLELAIEPEFLSAQFLVELFGLPFTQQVAMMADSITDGHSDFEPMPSTPASLPKSTHSTVSLVNVADEVKIKTTLVSGYRLDRTDFYLHQANGGGIAIIDYDRDGRSDIYFSQNGGDPNIVGTSASNELHRQWKDRGFESIAAASGCDDDGFGQGVAVADLNQDGFDDLVIGNIGPNSTLLNQGDGTFRPSDSVQWGEPRWTSSVGVADLDGDDLPDIVEVNYIDDPAVFRTKCVDQRIECVPQRFRPAADRLFINSRAGRQTRDAGFAAEPSAAKLGLGVVIADFDEDNAPEVFVGNDGEENQWWRWNRSAADVSTDAETRRFVDAASVAGLAVGGSGEYQACMGIAAGDFDRDQRLDLFVTNFHGENNALYRQRTTGLFVDSSAKSPLTVGSREELGFGAQAADFDNDGWTDLLWVNGHLYDATYAGIDFRMKPTLALGGDDGLRRIQVGSAYFDTPSLGRSLATFDLGRDGDMDAVVNHLDQPIAVLENQMDASQSRHRWVQFELVGTRCERTAAAARVRIRVDDQTWTLHRSAGDGYMAANERILHLGLGEVSSLDSVEVAWPDGSTQKFDSLAIDRRHLLIQE